MQRSLERLQLVLLSGFVLIALALGYWQFFRQDDVLARATNPRIAEEARRVVRGKILDRTGKVLAENLPDEDGGNHRTYPVGGMAAVVGYHSGQFGNSGIEAKYDEYLSGTRSADPFERLRDTLYHRPTVGSDVTLTVDARIQQAANDALAGRPGAVVVLDPKTGAVLALASAPTFEPGALDEQWQALLDDPTRPLVNRAVGASYTPGSTFKLVTAAAALDLRLVDPRQKFRCVDPIKIDSLTVDCRNHAHLANVDFREAFAWSCNRTFALTALELGTPKLQLADGLKAPFPWQDALGASANRLEEYARRFMIGRPIPFEIGVEGGQLKGGNAWYPSLLAQTGFGQGEIATTPLHMALVAAAVANGGNVPAPYLTTEITSPSGAVSTQNRGGGVLGRAFEASTAQTLNEMMVLSVDTAYAKPAAIANVKVGGKTGSAEAGPDGSLTHSWFVGYAPADDPRVAIAVIMEHRGSGTDFATPAARSILQRALDVYKR
ncbi:MAG: penicillin-binding protein 2 [Chloroflexi bacterium]|nr:penicillin-binding protein 2 [Chloroflexota bacterium]